MPGLYGPNPGNTHGDQVACVCTCVCMRVWCTCVCTWGRDMGPPTWLLPGKVLNRDLRASGTAVVAPSLMQSFGGPGELQKTRTGVKRGGEELLRWSGSLHGSVAPSLRDRGHASPLSPLPERSCQAKRFKIDALINSIKRRLSSSEGRAAPAVSAGVVIRDGQGRNCCQGGGGRSCSPRFPSRRRLGRDGGSREGARLIFGGSRLLAWAQAPPGCAEG